MATLDNKSGIIPESMLNVNDDLIDHALGTGIRWDHKTLGKFTVSRYYPSTKHGIAVVVDFLRAPADDMPMPGGKTRGQMAVEEAQAKGEFFARRRTAYVGVHAGAMFSPQMIERALAELLTSATATIEPETPKPYDSGASVESGEPQPGDVVETFTNAKGETVKRLIARVSGRLNGAQGARPKVEG